MSWNSWSSCWVIEVVKAKTKKTETFVIVAHSQSSLENKLKLGTTDWMHGLLFTRSQFGVFAKIPTFSVIQLVPKFHNFGASSCGKHSTYYLNQVENDPV